MEFRVAVVAIAVLATAACGGKTAGTASVASSSPVTSSQSATATAVTPATVDTPAKGDKPTKAFVVGKWGTDGDCTLAVDLRADGTSDGPFGNWTYNDGVISFADEPDFRVTVTVLDDKTMESHNNGKTTKMTRCP